MASKRKIRQKGRSQKPEARSQKLQRFNRWLLPIALLLVLGCGAYWNSTDAPFVFDDLETIQRNAGVRFGDYFNPLQFFRTRSLLYVTYAFNNWIGGQNVFGYHALSLVLHILNGILIFGIALRIFKQIVTDGTVARLYAFFAAGFFLVHPIQTESVTYISGRSELVSTFFYLLGFGAFIATPERRIGFRTALVVLGFLLLGFGGKETVVTLPAAILLYDYLFLGKRSVTTPARLFVAACGRSLRATPPFQGGETILLRWRFYLTFVIAAAVSSYFLLAKQLMAFEALPANYSRWYYLLTQQRVIVRYIRLVVLPTGLNFLYDFRPSTSVFEPALLLSVLFLVGIVLAAWRWRTIKPIFSFSIFWFFITLSPTSSIVPIPDLIFEHRIYLPLAGVCLSFPFVMEWLVRRGNAVSGLASCVLVMLTIATVLRNEVWRDDVRLFSDAVAKSPNLVRAYNALMIAHMNRGGEEQAISVAKQASENVPWARASFQDTIGNLYLRLGKPQEAVTYFKSAGEEAVKIRASAEFIANSFNNLGVAYLALAKTESAEDKKASLHNARDSFRKSLEANPNNIRVMDSFVNASHSLGEATGLEQDLRKTLEVNPDDFRSNYELASLLSLQERYSDSLNYFQIAEKLDKSRAEELDKSNETLYFNFAFALAKAGAVDRAIDKYMQALRIDPLLSEARYNLSLLYIQKADYESAISSLNEVLQPEPTNVRANMKLAEIYAYQGKLPLARQHLRGVLQAAPQDAAALRLLQKIGS